MLFGNSTDEDPENLGEKLSQPPFLKDRREEMEAGLTPLPTTGAGGLQVARSRPSVPGKNVSRGALCFSETSVYESLLMFLYIAVICHRSPGSKPLSLSDCPHLTGGGSFEMVDVALLLLRV